MPDNELIMTLAKVLIAAAWVDGEITEEEVNCLKDLLWRLPEVHARQWDELDIYLDSPIDDVERAQLVDRLEELATDEARRNLAFQMLDDMVVADGEVTEAERAVVEQVKQELASGGAGLWGSFSRMLIGRRKMSLVMDPGREVFLDDFINNRVYYKVRQELDHHGVTWSVTDAELRRLSLAGALMALVARVDPEIADEERAVILDTLQTVWKLPRESALFVAEVALSDRTPLDVYRLTREFSEAYSLDERNRFLQTLFTVAAADGDPSFEEVEQIRSIALGFKLTQQEFIDAKMAVLRGGRAS